MAIRKPRPRPSTKKPKAKAAKVKRWWTVEVIETRTYRVFYVVEAANEREAEEMALIGETVEDGDGELLLEVTGRDVAETPKEVV